MDYNTKNSELFKRLKYEDCREEIIKLNMPLVRYICLEYFKNWDLRTFTMDDLYQEGYIVLIEAIDSYDSSRGAFSTYLGECIRHKLFKIIYDKAYMVYVPQSTVQACIRYRQTKEMSCSWGTLSKGLLALKVPIYLNSSAKRDEEEDTELIDFLSDDIDVEDECLNNTLKEVLDSMLDCLTDREVEVLNLRFGMGTHSCCTFAEIGAEFNLSPNRIRQIECNALKKLRRRAYLYNKELENYLY